MLANQVIGITTFRVGVLHSLVAGQRGQTTISRGHYLLRRHMLREGKDGGNDDEWIPSFQTHFKRETNELDRDIAVSDIPLVLVGYRCIWSGVTAHYTRGPLGGPRAQLFFAQRRR